MAKWMPLEPGDHEHENGSVIIDEDGTFVCTWRMSLRQMVNGNSGTSMPFRLCRLTDAPGDMPAEVRATMREALGELRHSPAWRVASYDDFVAKAGRGPVFWSEGQAAEWRTKVAAIDAALAYLDALP